MFHLCRKYCFRRKSRNNERLRWFQVFYISIFPKLLTIWGWLNLLWEALKFCLKLWKTKENLKIWFFFWTEFSAGISSDRFKIRAKKYKLYRAIIKLVMLVFLLGRASDLLTDWCCEKSGTFPKSFGAVQTNYRFVTICILQHFSNNQILCLFYNIALLSKTKQTSKTTSQVLGGGLRTHLTAILTTQKLY